MNSAVSVCVQTQKSEINYSLFICTTQQESTGEHPHAPEAFSLLPPQYVSHALPEISPDTMHTSSESHLRAYLGVETPLDQDQ